MFLPSEREKDVPTHSIFSGSQSTKCIPVKLTTDLSSSHRVNPNRIKNFHSYSPRRKFSVDPMTDKETYLSWQDPPLSRRKNRTDYCFGLVARLKPITPAFTDDDSESTVLDFELNDLLKIHDIKAVKEYYVSFHPPPPSGCSIRESLSLS